MLREMVLIYLIGQGQEHTSLARKNKTVNFTLWPIFQKNFFSDRPYFEFQKYLVIIIIIKYYNKAFFGTASLFFSVQTVLQLMMMTLMMRMMHWDFKLN